MAWWKRQDITCSEELEELKDRINMLEHKYTDPDNLNVQNMKAQKRDIDKSFSSLLKNCSISFAEAQELKSKIDNLH